MKIINLLFMIFILIIVCLINVKGEIPDVKRVVIIGFDGADYKLTDQWIKEGKLPNLAKLKNKGTFLPLMPTNPPQTPVSWASFSTGLNPGRTLIFDFLKRDKNTYYPTFAMMTEGSKPFLFGEKNALYISLISLIPIFLIGLILIKIKKRRRKLILIIFIILAGIISSGSYWYVQKYLPTKMPIPINNRKGKTFWRIVSEDGLKTVVFRVPTTFPAEELIDGEMLSGLGVPDMRGTIGQPSIYTDDSSLLARENEFSLKIILVDPEEKPIHTEILGPRNKFFYDPDKKEEMERKGIPERINIPLDINIDWDKEKISISSQKQQATLGLKEWSDWFVFEFKFNPIIKLKGIARFYLASLHPSFILYMSPLHFHPSEHRIHFSYPADWAEKLYKQFGLFKTMGWAVDTWTITSDLVDEDHFLSDMYFTVDQFEKMMKGLLQKKDYDLYIQIFYFTDRVQHVLWRLIDPEHPKYDKEKAEKYKNAIFDAYVRMDKIVGEAMELVPKDVLLIVCSDHGFTSFRRGINYNTWLVKNGFMTLIGQNEVKTLDDLFGQGDFFQNVDWSKTKAYALGLGPIYINLKGREPHGIVEPGEEYEKVRNEIIKGLEEYVDPETGLHPVKKVYKREEIYKKFDKELIPDLRAANNENYRVSWQTTLGGIPPDIVEDNMKNWSADHCSVDPSLVKGIFLSNFKINRGDPSITDIFPSVLKVFRIEPPSDIDGKSFY